MSPLFGGKDHDDHDDTAAMQAEAGRIAALPLSQLAAEVMTRGFGPDGPADDGRPSVQMIAAAFVPGAARLEEAAYRALYDTIGEGVQILEHACLVRGTVYGSTGGVFFTATRAGRAALAQGVVEQALGAGA